MPKIGMHRIWVNDQGQQEELNLFKIIWLSWSLSDHCSDQTRYKRLIASQCWMELPFKPIGCGSLIEIIIRWRIFSFIRNTFHYVKTTTRTSPAKKKQSSALPYMQTLCEDKETKKFKWTKCNIRLQQSSVDHNKYKCDDKDKYNWDRKKCKRRLRRSGVDQTQIQVWWQRQIQLK